MTQRNSHGFTLVELLVVIGIISILISMLMPALSKTRQAAMSVQCKSNLRQVILACMYYAQDNKIYPPIPNLTGSEDPATNRWGWYGGIFRYMGGTSPEGRDFLAGDFPAAGRCPVDTFDSPWKFSYGGNYPNVIGYSSNPSGWWRPGRVIRPGTLKSRVIVAGDTTYNLPLYSPAYFPPDMDLDGDGVNDTHNVLASSELTHFNAIQFRHPGKTANFAFSDGSVISLAPSQVYQSNEDIWGKYLYPYVYPNVP